VIHPITNRTELHGTKGSILEDHSWEKPVRVFSSHPDALVKGEYYSPDIEHQPFPGYYKISMGYEDAYFADCILKEREPEFTPQEAREGVAVVLLAYLSAKNERTTKMDELIKVYEKEGTKSILKGLEDQTQKNYESLNWN
jgi:predicted dehydrogenase